MSKYTAGPWHAHGPVVTAAGSRIAQTHFGENGDADALLVAASPDLLAALIELYDATTDGRPEVIRAARAVARRAMDKAENGTQEGT